MSFFTALIQTERREADFFTNFTLLNSVKDIESIRLPNLFDFSL